jgi:hypothetical protein
MKLRAIPSAADLNRVFNVRDVEPKNANFCAFVTCVGGSADGLKQPYETSRETRFAWLRYHGSPC